MPSSFFPLPCLPAQFSGPGIVLFRPTNAYQGFLSISLLLYCLYADLCICFLPWPPKSVCFVGPPALFSGCICGAAKTRPQNPERLWSTKRASYRRIYATQTAQVVLRPLRFFLSLLPSSSPQIPLLRSPLLLEKGGRGQLG